MSTRRTFTLLGLFVVVTASIFIISQYIHSFQDNQRGNNPALKRAGRPTSVSTTVQESRFVAGGEVKTFGTRDVQETNGKKHSVPLGDILGGGPPKDGIPSIDDPKFINVDEASGNLDDSSPGIALSFNGVDRFYPYQILVWHEIVNDEINGKPVLVTYCPLCLTGVVYSPLVDGEYVEFGTSGKLWNSNLVMYDRKTDSYWSQVLGEAIVGSETGSKLEIVPSDQVLFGQWKKQFPDGEVLSRDTGAFRLYGVDPYGDYYINLNVIFPVDAEDDRTHPKTFVLGIVIDGQAKAYDPEAVKRDGGFVRDTFAGRTIIAEIDEDIDVLRLFEEREDGIRERLLPVSGFWFSWVAVYPETGLYN